MSKKILVLKTHKCKNGRTYKQGTSGWVDEPNLSELIDAKAVKVFDAVTFDDVPELKKKGFNIEVVTSLKKTKEEKKFDSNK